MSQRLIGRCTPSTKYPQPPEKYMSYVTPFEYLNFNLPKEVEAVICWWISPQQFYIQENSRIAEFDELMSRLQNFYQNKPKRSVQLKVGSYVVAFCIEDNLFYRARIIEIKITLYNPEIWLYKMYFVDTGKECVVTSWDVFRVEEQFSKLPCMAYQCTLKETNADQQLIGKDSKIICQFLERIKEDEIIKYYVNMKTRNISLKDDCPVISSTPSKRISWKDFRNISLKDDCPVISSTPSETISWKELQLMKTFNPTIRLQELARKKEKLLMHK